MTEEAFCHILNCPALPIPHVTHNRHKDDWKKELGCKHEIVKILKDWYTEDYLVQEFHERVAKEIIEAFFEAFEAKVDKLEDE